MNKKEKVEQQYFTVREVALKLNLSPVTVREMIKKGIIKAISFGERSLRVDKGLLEDYIERLEEENPYKKGLKK